MESLLRDLRYAFRMLAAKPLFTAVVVVSLALGIGANSTIFTIVNAVFLHPLPVEDSARLVSVYTTDEKNRGGFSSAQGRKQRLEATARFGLRNVLVVSQLALSLVSLAGAGLFIQSLRHAQQIDVGFDIDHLVGRGALLTLIGVAVGLAATLLLARFAATLLYGSANNLPTFAVVAALLSAVAMAACYVPARRATRVDPIVALRYE